MESAKEQKVKRITAFNIVNYKTCPEEFILKIKELHCSTKTEKIYKDAFEDYLDFHHKIDINRLSEGHIQAFLRHLVMEHKEWTN